MTEASQPDDDALAMAQADLRDLQHRLAVVERQHAFLLGAIDAKVIEIDRLEHPEAGEPLEKVGEKVNKGVDQARPVRSIYSLYRGVFVHTVQ